MVFIPCRTVSASRCLDAAVSLGSTWRYCEGQSLLRLGQFVRQRSMKAGTTNLRLFVALLCGCAIPLTPLTSPAANFTITDGNIAALKNAIVTSNSNGQDDVIDLATNGSYLFTTVDHFDSDSAPNALPAITADGGHSLVINGHGATTGRSTAGGTPQMRIFQLVGATVTMNALVISNANVHFVGTDEQGGGGIYSMQSNLLLNQCIFMSNSIKGPNGPDGFDCGGACANGQNGVRALGGALYCLGGSATLNDCALNTNTAAGGNGGNGFGQNGSGGEGGLARGGALCSQSCALAINRSVFVSNSAVAGPGGTAGGPGGFSGNPGSGVGGAIFVDADTAAAQFDKDACSGNSAEAGGAIYVTSGSSSGVSVDRCTFSTNNAPLFGGAIKASGLMMVRRNSFLNNTSGRGGAIDNDGALTVANCTFYNNSAGAGGGGAIFNGDNTLSLTNCTLSGNTTSAAGSAGGLRNQATASLSNNIFRHGATGANIVDAANAVPSIGHNISDDAAGGGAGTGPGGYLNGPGDLRNSDPQLASNSPQDNGGPTQTFALIAGSPAIDRADNTQAPHRDQRGYLRHGPADIGAFEDNGEILRMVSIAKTGTNLQATTATFEVVDGFTYRLQRKLTFAGLTTWQNISGVPDRFATDDDTETITDPNGAGLTEAFYHVIVVPP
jgi:hypothetical protein